MKNDNVKIARAFISFFLIGVQLGFVYFVFGNNYGAFKLAFWANELLGILLVIFVVSRRQTNQIKVTWVLFALMFPLCAFVSYVLWGYVFFSSKTPKALEHLDDLMAEQFKQDVKVLEANNDCATLGQIDIVAATCGFPVYENTRLISFESGEITFETLNSELLKAKKTIFMEYYKMERGAMFSEILAVLTAKAREGVDVRILVDKTGSGELVKGNFIAESRKKGIKVSVFSSSIVTKNPCLNYYNNRKTTIIDGNTAICGNLDITDKSIDHTNKDGQCSDVCLMLRGDAVWSLTVMFLTMWDVVSKTQTDYFAFKPTISYLEEKSLVMPFCDGAENKRGTKKYALMKMIVSANNYIYIKTPSLIVDADVTAALTLAARAGVLVKIITASVSSDSTSRTRNRAFYDELSANGVQIFEFLPQKQNAAVVCCDDKFGFFGSSVFDFETTPWAFNSGVWVANSEVVIELREDFVDSLTHCRIHKRQALIVRIFEQLLKLVSPLI